MLRILTYHRIAEASRDPHLNPRLISASPDDFASQMRFLARHYQVVDLEDVLIAFETGRRLPRRAVLITFDDAYRDFLEIAWPILQAHRLPSTMFVASAYPNRPERSFWWDRLYRCCTDPSRSELVLPKTGVLPLRTREDRLAALRLAIQRCKSLPHDHAMALVEEICDQLGEDETAYPSVLDWDEIRQLARENVRFCPHTQWHPLLTRVAPARAHTEIAGSFEDLRRQLDDVLPVFAYPDGAHDDEAVRIVGDVGFRLALTQVDGHNHPRKSDPLRLCRTNITPRTSLPVLRLRLQTWFTHIDRWRHRRKGDSQAQRAVATRHPSS